LTRQGLHVIRGRWVYRDRAEWIPVTVPTIVSRELFDTVHEKLRLHEERYCRPITHYLLHGLVQCGVCGSRCSSSRGYHRVVRPSGRVCVYHRAAYRCNRRAQENRWLRHYNQERPHASLARQSPTAWLQTHP
jgi:transposase InsO family protein